MRNFENLQKWNYTLTLGGIHFGPYLGQGLKKQPCTSSRIMLMHNSVGFCSREENTHFWQANN